RMTCKRDGRSRDILIVPSRSDEDGALWSAAASRRFSGPGGRKAAARRPTPKGPLPYDGEKDRISPPTRANRSGCRRIVSLGRPSHAMIRGFLDQQAKLNLTYAAIGATSAVPPHGYVVDHTRIKLGEGKEVFQRATSALGRWDQFQLGWVEAWSPETPIRTG